MKIFLAVLFLPFQISFDQAVDSSPAPATRKPAVEQLIPWLLDENQQLRGLPFTEVIFDATGKRVLPVNRKDEIDQRVIKQISTVLDEVMKKMNAADNSIQKVDRINEVSSNFENWLRDSLNTVPGLSCNFPTIGNDKIQRSGYPDLRLVDLASKRVFYLDPKLYAAGSRESNFRAFYFEPKITTNKVRDDAVHLVAGFEHEPRTNGRWNFTRWDLVDLSKFKVRLKAEFQGSNRDIYRPEAIVATSAK